MILSEMEIRFRWRSQNVLVYTLIGSDGVCPTYVQIDVLLQRRDIFIGLYGGEKRKVRHDHPLCLTTTLPW